jgi:hypothetical protein
MPGRGFVGMLRYVCLFFLVEFLFLLSFLLLFPATPPSLYKPFLILLCNDQPLVLYIHPSTHTHTHTNQPPLSADLHNPPTQHRHHHHHYDSKHKHNNPPPHTFHPLPLPILSILNSILIPLRYPIPLLRPNTPPPSPLHRPLTSLGARDRGPHGRKGGCTL